MRLSMNREFTLFLIRSIFGTGLGKIGGSIALLGASSATGILPLMIYAAAEYFFNWSIPPSDAPIWFGVFLVVAGLSTAILGAYWQRTPPASPQRQNRQHDMELYRRYRVLITEHELRFLRDFDFGNPFDMERIKGVCEFAERWEGARCEFSDPQFEAAFRSVKKNARGFCNAVAKHVHCVRGNPLWGTTKPDHFNGEYSPTLLAANKELNDQATEFHKSADEFERLAGPELWALPISS